MSKNQYKVSLTSEQRKTLKRIVNRKSESAFKIRNAKVLLKTDSSKGGENSDKAIAKEFNLSVGKIEQIQQRFIERGIDIAINSRPGAKNITVNAASDTGTSVDFGVGNVSVKPDGSTLVNYPGGTVNVDLSSGNGVSLSGTGITTTDTGGVNLDFFGGNLAFDPIKGFSLNYPGGSVTYDPAKGLVVKYVGGEVSYPLTGNGLIQFPGGSVNLGQNGASVQFPGGFVNAGTTEF
jgi:hypothetical protein